MRAFDAPTIWMSRLRGRVLKRRFPAQSVLVLLPHCLQHQSCKQPVKESILNCKGCGRCKIKDLRRIAERLGVHVHIASGGREAMNRAGRPEVRAILAVACSKELAEGIRAVFPKRVVGVLNAWPEGPCKNTDVDVKQVEAALESMIEPKEGLAK